MTLKKFSGGKSQPQQQQQTINVDPRKKETVECPSCGESKLFEQFFVIKRIPKMEVGRANHPCDIPYPIPVFACTSCGEILEEFVPHVAGMTYKELMGENIDL